MKTILLTLLAATVPVLAQTSIPDAIAKHWKTSGEFTMEVAKAMPAGSYDFRPSPEERGSYPIRPRRNS